MSSFERRPCVLHTRTVSLGLGQLKRRLSRRGPRPVVRGHSGPDRRLEMQVAIQGQDRDSWPDVHGPALTSGHAFGEQVRPLPLARKPRNSLTIAFASRASSEPASASATTRSGRLRLWICAFASAPNPIAVREINGIRTPDRGSVPACASITSSQPGRFGRRTGRSLGGECSGGPEGSVCLRPGERSCSAVNGRGFADVVVHRH